MKLNELPSSHKRKQRIGRGGKRGTTAGRGTKGQKSRAGNRRRPAERDLIQRLPKLRGYRNKPKTDTVTVFNLEDLVGALKSAEKGIEITEKFLQASKLLSKNFNGRVKILGDGEIAVPITVGKGISVSASARVKIEKAGGSIA